jgi:hypothetical protein
VLEDAGLLLCEDDDLPGPFCESLEQPGFLTLGVVPGLPRTYSPLSALGAGWMSDSVLPGLAQDTNAPRSD